MRYTISRRVVRAFAVRGLIGLVAPAAALGQAPPNSAAPVAPALVAPVVVPPAETIDDASRDTYKKARVSLPMSYEENRGQFDERVQFVGRGSGLLLFVSGRETTFEIFGERRENGAPRRAIVRMRLEGASTTARAEGLEKLPGVVNYIKGEDRRGWHTDVPTWARILVPGVYPGVDMVFRGTRATPEYDFVLAPGADPRTIRFRLDGAASLAIDDEGDLRIGTSVGEIEHRRPFVYQIRGNERVQVDGEFELAGNRVGFRVGAYDRSLPLTIDPAVGFSTLAGGDGHEEVEGLAVDDEGNVYFCGSTSSDDYPLLNPIQNRIDGNTAAFVTKMNSRGSAIVYSTFLDSDDIDLANAIDVDPSGRAAVAGRANYSGWPVTNQYARHGPFFDVDVTVAVLTPAGNDVVYCTYIGGRDVDEALACAWDLNGNLYVAGKTESANFPVKSPSNLPPRQSQNGGGFDGFVVKLDPDESGNTSLVYSTFLGGSGTEHVLGIDVDDFERAYVTGVTGSFNFPTTNAIQPTQGGINDAFVTKYNADGTAVFYSTYLGGNGPDQGDGIAAASDGSSVVIVGKTDSTNFRLLNAFQTTPGDAVPNNGKPDAFISKLNSSGSAFTFSTYLGGPGNDFATDIDLDSAGNIFISGFAATGFPFINPVPIEGLPATTGALIARVTPGGTVTLATAIDNNATQGRGIAVDSVGDVYLAGTTVSTNFPTIGDPFQSIKNDFGDAYVLKLDLVDDDTIGTVGGRVGTPFFHLTSTNIAQIADVTASFGAVGEVPIRGDWDGDGIDTIGTYNNSTGRFNLRNSNTSGPAELSFIFGVGGQIPIAGDWDGDGIDTIGVFEVATGIFFLRNSNTEGVADLQFVFGPGGAGFAPVAGDWEGDGVDTIGLYQASTRTFFLRSVNADGVADFQFVFGSSSSRAIVGDWNGDGVDTIGTARAGIISLSFSLRNSNTAGAADITKNFGNRLDTPIAGNWDGQ